MLSGQRNALATGRICKELPDSPSLSSDSWLSHGWASLSAESRKSNASDLYYRQQMLCARVGNVLVWRLALRVSRRLLDDDDRIRFESLEAAPRLDEGPFIATPRIEVAGGLYQREVGWPLVPVEPGASTATWLGRRPPAVVPHR